MTWVPRLNRNTYEALRHFLSPVRSWEWWIFPGGILMLLFIHCNHWPELMLEKTVIMNQNNRNKPEMLWMETFFAKLFWKWDCLEVDSVLTTPFSQSTDSWIQFGSPDTSLKTQPRCCLLQESAWTPPEESGWISDVFPMNPGFPLTDPSSYICLFH